MINSNRDESRFREVGGQEERGTRRGDRPRSRKGRASRRWEKPRKEGTLRFSPVSFARVSRVTKGGKQRSLRLTVAVGNGEGQVAVGMGKALDFSAARVKAIRDAKRSMIKFPLTGTRSIPHEITANFGAAKILLRPMSAGTGVKAGRLAYVILTLGGIENIMAKQLGSVNRLNNARAVIRALTKLKN